MKEDNQLVCIYKKRGETPLQALDRLRMEMPEFKDAKLSYAGRLDPMAEGILLIMVGDANYNREQYLNLDKTYITDILFGIDTDTGDILGKVLDMDNKLITEKEILENLDLFRGEIEQKYPNFSSKTFNGKPLFQHTREGNSDLDIKHTIVVKEIKLKNIFEINSDILLEKIQRDISLVRGDFRQDNILEIFKEKLYGINRVFQIATLELKVSSGFYVRQFAKDLAEKMKTKALALRIYRTEIGDFKAVDYML